MEKNPVFDFSESSMTDKSGTSDHLSSSPLKVKQATKPRCSGRLCATATFAIVAVLAIMVLTAVVGVMFAKAQFSEVKNKHSAELEKLKKEMEILKKLVDQQANNSITQQIVIQEIRVANQDVQKQLSSSTKDLNDTIQDVLLLQHSSNYALKEEIKNATQRIYTNLLTSQIEQIQTNVSELSEQIQLQRKKSSQDILTILQVTNDSRSECKLQIEDLRNFTESTTDEIQQQILAVQVVLSATGTISKQCMAILCITILSRQEP